MARQVWGLDGPANESGRFLEKRRRPCQERSTHAVSTNAAPTQTGSLSRTMNDTPSKPFSVVRDGPVGALRGRRGRDRQFRRRASRPPRRHRDRTRPRPRAGPARGGTDVRAASATAFPARCSRCSGSPTNAPSSACWRRPVSTAPSSCTSTRRWRACRPRNSSRKSCCERLAVSGVVIGFDFHFGLNRQGSPDFLIAQGAKHGFAVDIVPCFEDEGRPVRSGPIRAALATGQVIEAAELLGFPGSSAAKSCTATSAGANWDFPPPTCGSTPIAGSSTGSMRSGSASATGITTASPISAGGRCSTPATRCWRSFLFDFSGDLYGKVIDVAFIGWIRPEMKFDGLPALIEQMKDDTRIARQALARAPDAFPKLGRMSGEATARTADRLSSARHRRRAPSTPAPPRW